MLKLLKSFKLSSGLKHNRLTTRILAVNNQDSSTCMLKLTIGHPVLERKQYFCQKPLITFQEIDSSTFEKVCEDTLESLTEYFEELVENDVKLQSGDVSYSSGVLTVNLENFGTYVINRQSPNKQIWLSSPTSGPKRYDFALEENCWVYKHDCKTLHELIQNELSNILGKKVDMSKCAYYKIK